MPKQNITVIFSDGVEKSVDEIIKLFNAIKIKYEGKVYFTSKENKRVYKNIPDHFNCS